MLLALSVSCVAQLDPNRVIATVNGEDIKAADYYRRLEVLNLQDAVSRFGPKVQFPGGFIALDQLINEKILLQLAKEKGVLPSDVEVRAEIDRIKVEEPKFGEQWATAGRTDAELMYRVRYDLASFKLLSYGINVTDQELEAFYKENPNQFTTPKTYKLRVIVVTEGAKKDQVDAQLRSGKSFADVAKELSEDVSKAAGGEYGAITLSKLPEFYAKPVEATKIGNSTAWVEGKDATAPNRTQYVKFFVEDITPEKLLPLDAKMRRDLRRHRMATLGGNKNDMGKEIKTALLKAKIEVFQKEYAEPYRKLIEAIREASGGATVP